MKFLLLDFGASRIKAALGQTIAPQIIFSKDYPAGTPQFSDGHHCEIDLTEIANRVKQILADFKDEDIAAIYFSCEMHGFLLANEQHQPLTNYISWKDERCLNPYRGQTYFSYLNQKIDQKFKTLTGMTARPCFPFYNLFVYLTENYSRLAAAGTLQVWTLADYIASLFKDYHPQTHCTMAHGLGLFNIYQQAYDATLLDLLAQTGLPLHFNPVVPEVIPVAVWPQGRHQIPLYCGVGDHPTAVLGALTNGLGPTDSAAQLTAIKQRISFNLGTGAQISLVATTPDTPTDVRPFFGGKYLHTITHIPSGRALNEYIAIFGSDVWPAIDQLQAADLQTATLDFDLAIFSSAANFNHYQGIRNIREQSLTRQHYLASLIRSYADQFITLLEHFTLPSTTADVVLSGGIAHHLKALPEYFAQKLPYPIHVTTTTTEETFRGLWALAAGKK